MRDMHPLLELPPSGLEADGDRKFVTSLARGLEILRAFGGGRPLSNSELAKKTGLPKPTISRLTYTLTRMGYLEYLPKLERYQPGTAALGLGYAYLLNSDQRRIAGPYMQELSDYSGGTVAISARDRFAMVYREVRSSPKLISRRLGVGAQIPLARSAAGMAAIYAMGDCEKEDVLRGLRERTSDWPAVQLLIDETHEQLAKRGFCVARGGVFSDSLAVAVPVTGRDGSATIVYNCAGPDYLLNEDKAFNDIGPRLRHMTAAIDADATSDRGD